MRRLEDPRVQRPSRVLTDGGAPGARGQQRHRILRELQRELERHPAVEHVVGTPEGKFRELRASLDPTMFGVPEETATLRVTWWPAPDGPEYAFHYSESSGFDCGWHKEPNPHVDGTLHYQERNSPDDDYQYEPVSFAATTPPRILWTILDRLGERRRRE